jgi:peptide/nickel transport system substrate-binding protein
LDLPDIKNPPWLFASLVLLASALASCSGDGSSPKSPAQASPAPYGGDLNIGTVYSTMNALSWDSVDFPWKHNHDTGMVFEQLFAANLQLSKRHGGPYSFYQGTFIAEEALTGELAESWEWEAPLALTVHLRHGVRFPAKKGVMEARELTADDVVFSFERLDQSPRKIKGYFDHIDSVVARDSHTVVFEFSSYNPEWPYRFGHGYYSGIAPRELGQVDAKDWHNTTGSGPFQLERYLQGNSQRYVRNPDYWGQETLDGRQYQLPFVDSITYRIIKDEATLLTALRTGKIDILEKVRWLSVDHLKKSTPELSWSKRLQTGGTFIALRNDKKPFDDVRVRRALNLAINQQEIVDIFFGGHAEVLGFPMHPEYLGYYQPLEEMPASVRELYEYHPDKAKRLLAEAGYANGFTFKTQLSTSNTDNRDLAPLIASYLAKVGVTMEIEELDYAAFLSAMNTGTHAPGYFLEAGHTSPTVSIRRNFQSGNIWNSAMFSDPKFDRGLDTMMSLRDESERQAKVRELTVTILDQAPYIWLPTYYVYGAWWPWVKNYGGELAAGAVRPGPIYARIWIDQELKQSLGF